MVDRCSSLLSCCSIQDEDQNELSVETLKVTHAEEEYASKFYDS